MKIKCQLNYIVVIGDGAQKHHAQAMNVIKQLRLDGGVKTIVVAYGGGINGNPLKQFKQLAVAGSCNVAGDDDYRELTSDTPERLKQNYKVKLDKLLLKDYLLQHHQLQQPFKRVEIYIKHSLITNSMENGKVQF